MRTAKALLIVLFTAGLAVFAAGPASATTKSVSLADGDTAYYNNATNVLTACDNSPGNGVTRAQLKMWTGNIWQLYDANGAQPGCSSSGPLSVDNSQKAWLIVCPDSSGVNCVATDPFPA